MECKVGDVVVMMSRANKKGAVVQTGLHSNDGIQWVEVKFGKTRRWMLADRLREAFGEFIPIPVPDGVIVLAGNGHQPIVFDQPGSMATRTQLEEFAEALERMWMSKQVAA